MHFNDKPLGDRYAPCRAGDYTVEHTGEVFTIGRVLASNGARSWTALTRVETSERARNLALGLAADHQTRALYSNGTDPFTPL